MSGWRAALLLFVAGGPGCAGDPAGELAQAAMVCAKGATVPGIDVSKWQGTIDWSAVASSGVVFAFIRVNHGLDDIDEEFAASWSGARRAGVVRGAYQYFLPDEDAVAQADLFLARMGPLEPGDLPPVLDVEDTGGGLPPEAIVDQVQRWMDRVEAGLGLRPIIYTGKYFWQDNVGSNDFAAHPLWIAHWNVVCPDLPEPWSDWTFHQTSDSGSVPGIAGAVDTDLFNGSLEELEALAVAPACAGSADCASCPVMGPSGGVVDDTGPCFHESGGPGTMQTANAGYASFLRWTHATDEAEPTAGGVWQLDFAESGRYLVEAHTPAPWGESRRAVYTVTRGDGELAIEIDQSAVDGWNRLGELDFAAGGGQSIRLDDNTGEPAADQIKIVFDAIRLTRVDRAGTGEPPGPSAPDQAGGCSAARGTGGILWFCLALLGRLAWKRRARFLAS